MLISNDFTGYPSHDKIYIGAKSLQLTMRQQQVLILSDDAKSAHIWALGISQLSVPSMAIILTDERLDRLPLEAFDLVMLDMNCDSGKVSDYCRKVRTLFDGPLLLLTHKVDERCHLRAYRMGVDESIHKPIGLHLAIAKIEAWLRAVDRFRVKNRTAPCVTDLRLDTKRRMLETPAGCKSQLSVRETELLKILLQRRGCVVSSDDIVSSIWHEDERASDHRLRGLIYRLRHKIEPDPGNPIYLETIAGQGYRITENDR